MKRWIKALPGILAGGLADLIEGHRKKAPMSEDELDAEYEKINKIYQKLPEYQQEEVDRFIDKLIADQERDDARKLEGG